MRTLRRLLVLLIGLPLALLAGENVFLNTGLRLLVNMQPEWAQLSWSHAYSIVPGHVEVWDLRVRVQDEGSQWQVTADHATGRIDLLALLEYRFVGQDVQATGATFRWRARRAEGSPPGPTSTEPAIEGLSNPPSPAPEAAHGPQGRLFRIQLENLEVENLREIWVGDYRMVGDFRLAGTVDVLQGEWAAVPDLAIDVSGAELRVGEVLMASSLRGRIDLQLEGSDPATHAGNDILTLLGARIALDADVHDLRFLSFYLRRAPWLSVSGGAGVLSLDLVVSQGVVQPGSHLEVDADEVMARFLSYAVTGDARVRLTVSPGPASTGRLTLEFLNFAVQRGGEPAAHALGAGLTVSADTSDLSLAQPFLALDIRLDLPDSAVPDLGVYNVYLPRELGLVLRSGEGSAKGHFAVSTRDNVATGALLLAATGVRARLEEVQLSGNLALEARLVRGELDTGVYDVSGTKLKLHDIVVEAPENARRGRDDSRRWWGELMVVEGQVTPGAPFFLDAKLATRFRDSVPFVTLFSQANPLPGWARGLLAVQQVSGEASVLLGDEAVVLRSLHLEGGRSEVRLRLRRRDGEFSGSLYARYGVFSAGVLLLGPLSTVHLFDARDWYDGQSAP